jgi:hypothetical protein
VIVGCPDAQYVGGMDFAIKMAGLYDLGRKCLKWWERMFYQL